MASAVADVAAARRDYLDESGGRYVHVIADGSIGRSGDIAKAVACGADAVMVGSPLARADRGPGPRLPLGLRGLAPAPAARRAHRDRHRRHARGDPVRPLPRRRRHDEPRRRAAPGDGHDRLHRAQGVPAGRGRRPVTLAGRGRAGRVGPRGRRRQRRHGGLAGAERRRRRAPGSWCSPSCSSPATTRPPGPTTPASRSTTTGCVPLRDAARERRRGGRRGRRTPRDGGSDGVHAVGAGGRRRRGGARRPTTSSTSAADERELLHSRRPRRHDRRRRLGPRAGRLLRRLLPRARRCAATAGGASAYLVPAAYYVGAEHRRDVYYAARALDNGIYVVFAGLTGPLRGRRRSAAAPRSTTPRAGPVRLGAEPGLVVADLDADEVRPVQRGTRWPPTGSTRWARAPGWSSPLDLRPRPGRPQRSTRRARGERRAGARRAGRRRGSGRRRAPRSTRSPAACPSAWSSSATSRPAPRRARAS